MAASDAQVARLRRMVNEPDSSTYSDAELKVVIERYPLVDENGESPRVLGVAGLMEENEDWLATYDLCAAAGDIWGEKAAAASANYDFAADGGSYNRSQVATAYSRLAASYRARRSPKTITLTPSPLNDLETGEEV
jgi:hypothetical protein